ncbi:BRCA1-associated RING domain protein 1-like isoform X2 [Mya arenaria]|uniref:BRCA1-associated RING domain protein 1-like isoform X2 n=1 Tax=Mya arenaria TaxID=6604 RepID=UPI0022DF5F16|nr:BRCA1-associated RING domain protein 1-like isoform X2 [Mya arenaria]
MDFGTEWNSFSNTRNALADLETHFKCKTCTLFAVSPVTLGGCEHIFCSLCCETYLGGSCPVCNIPADVRDADVDRQLFTLASLCRSLRQVLDRDGQQLCGSIHQVLDSDGQQEMDMGQGSSDVPIQCTPNQPIPGCKSHVGHNHVIQNEPIDNTELSGEIENRNKKKRKTRTSSSLEVTASIYKPSPGFEKSKPITSTKKSKPFRNTTSSNGGRDLPSDQTSTTQFYECDSDENDLEMVKHTESKQLKDKRKTQGMNKDKDQRLEKGRIAGAVSDRKTRLRHSLDTGLAKTKKTIDGIGEKSEKGLDVENMESFVNTCTTLRRRSSRKNSSGTNNLKGPEENESENIITSKSIIKETSSQKGNNKSVISTKTVNISKKWEKLALESEKLESEKVGTFKTEGEKTCSKKSHRRASQGAVEDQFGGPVSSKKARTAARPLDGRDGTKPAAKPDQSQTPVAERKIGEKRNSLTPSTPVGRLASKSQGLTLSPALNKRNAKGETQLQVAVIKNDVRRVQELLALGANPNVRDNAGWTPLHEACNHGYLDLVELLLDSGAMINVPGLENDTPLHDSVTNSRLDCVKMLVSRGASLTVRNMHGQTAVDLAQTERMREALRTPVISQAVMEAEQPVDVLEYQAPCLLGTGLSREEKVQLQKTVTQLHVKLADDISPQVTHIVTKVNSEGMCPRTIKTVIGILTGKWIVNMDWIETSLQMGSLVYEEAFEVPGTSLYPGSLAPSKGRKNRQQQLPGLFDGCKFYFSGSFEFAVPSKEDLTRIITSGGGSILSREPKQGHLDNDLVKVPYHADPSGDLGHCCVYVIYENLNGLAPIKTKYICSVTSAWIMDSASNFRLTPLSSVG